MSNVVSFPLPVCIFQDFDLSSLDMLAQKEASATLAGVHSSV